MQLLSAPATGPAAAHRHASTHWSTGTRIFSSVVLAENSGATAAPGGCARRGVSSFYCCWVSAQSAGAVETSQTAGTSTMKPQEKGCRDWRVPVGRWERGCRCHLHPAPPHRRIRALFSVTGWGERDVQDKEREKAGVAGAVLYLIIQDCWIFMATKQQHYCTHQNNRVKLPGGAAWTF